MSTDTIRNNTHVRSFFCTSTNTWTYLVVDTTTRVCALIDTVLDFDMPSASTTTTSADKLIAIIEKESLTLEWILETHVHADHLTASAYIKDYFKGRPKVAIGEHIKAVLAHWVPIFWGATPSSAPPTDGSQFDVLFKDGSTFNIGSLTVMVFHTPGHTPACVAYYIKESNEAFVGDTIFMPAIGTARTDFPGGSPKILYNSCRRLMVGNGHINKDTILHVGHDYPSSGKKSQHAATVAEHLKSNCMMNERVTEKEFIDANQEELPVPRLLLPALQVNLRAGRFGKDKTLVIPMNLFNKKKAAVSKL